MFISLSHHFYFKLYKAFKSLLIAVVLLSNKTFCDRMNFISTCPAEIRCQCQNVS